MTAMSLPTTVNSTNYDLLPASKFYTTRRNGKALGIGLHVTAGLQDLGMVGTDESNEGTIKWALDRRPEVSWHAICDSDDAIPCVPDWYTAWHIKGYNSRTIGIEISNIDARWDNKPAAWVKATIRQAARAAAAYVKKYDFPLKLSTKSQVDAAIASNTKFGFTYHAFLNPDTRIDPGKTFPWSMFISMVKEELGLTPETPGTPPLPPPPAPTNVLEVDGDWGPKTTTQAQKVLRSMGYPIVVDGKIDPDDSLMTRGLQRLCNSRGKTDAEGQKLVVDGKGIQSNSTGRYPAAAGSTTDTIEALCKLLGIRVKGHFAEGEEYTVKKFQERLNTGKL